MIDTNDEQVLMGGRKDSTIVWLISGKKELLQYSMNQFYEKSEKPGNEKVIACASLFQTLFGVEL